MPAVAVTTDQVKVMDVVARYMMCVDKRRYEDAIPLFCDDVLVDYCSLRPSEKPSLKPARALIAEWRARHEPITAFQHHLGAMVADINGDEATCFASGLAVHSTSAPGGEGMLLWSLGVAYDWTLRRMGEHWRIASIKATKLWERSDICAFKQASDV